MRGITRAWIIFTLTALVFSLGLVFYARTVEAQDNPPADSDAAIREAVQMAVEGNKQAVLGFLINDIEVNHIVYANDGRTALVWLAQRDQATGDIIGREPALALAKNAQGALAQAGDWQITFEFSGDISAELDNLPPELVTEEIRQRFASAPDMHALSLAAFTGYKLPWSTALNIKITGSIGHFLDYGSCSETSCRYAYDFWNPDAGNRMFPLLASKGGVVQAFRESCANNSTSCANYLVLRDDSTSPTTYQLYYHIANNSVPSNLSVGTYVQQGQYIGNVDDTGYSSDHHLHFHVYTAGTWDYSWGNSVQIRFTDVPYNNGEPRTCAETVNHPGYGTECSRGPDGVKLTADDNYLKSGNTGAYPPSGSLSAPAAWTTLTERMVTVSGTASDNQGIARVQVLVNYDGAWRAVADANHSGGSYTASLDLCSLGIPNGPFALAVRIWDIEGNWVGEFTGTRQLFNNASCSSTSSDVIPACAPLSSEVAIYSEPNFSGSCKKFTAGKYSAAALAPIGDNAIQSIQVGSGVRGVLFERGDDLNLTFPLGRVETFTADDANLAENRIGARQASALWVFGPTDLANPSLLEPYLTYPGNQVDADRNSAASPNPPNPKSTDSLVLAWHGGRGATLFTGTLVRGTTTVKTLAAQRETSWPVGTLDPGTYTWTITACNGLTTCSGALTNSTSLTFTVDAAALPTPAPVSAPTGNFDFEAGGGDWAATGLWHWGDANRLQPDLSTATTKAWIFNNGVSINDAAFRAGDLTSPPLTINAAGSYYLYFKQFSGVEGPVYAGQTFGGAFWDQRRVQVSLNGGPFTDVSGGMMLDDTQNSYNYWTGVALPLGSYSAGQTVRIRFHFDAIDFTNNDVFGWAVDDISLTSVPFDPGCKDNNDNPATATPITLGSAVNNSICPTGDVDVFSFSGTAGATLRIDLDAKSLDASNPLDSFITLLDSSGSNVLAANDDEDLNNGEPRYRDSYISYTLPRSATYYVRIKAWDHPGGGSVLHTYRLTPSQTTSVSRPVVSILQPPNTQRLPVEPFIVEAAASDPSGTGVRQVDFYWHSNDWTNGSWVKFATDTTPGDGWWGIFVPEGDTTGSAFYFMATSNSGGTNGVLATNLAPDLTAPSSAMVALPAASNSTAVQLQWAAEDLQNDILRFDIQYRLNGGVWTDWAVKPGPGARSAWFIGQPGTYEFRMRAADVSGNVEAYPAAAETSTTISATCVNDSAEPGNNTRGGAVGLTASGTRDLVLCQSDTDWASFSAQAGQEILLQFSSLSGGAAVQVRLYASGSTTPLLQATAVGAGQSLPLRWTAPATGTYLLEMLAVDPNLYGSGAVYRVYAGEGYWSYLAQIQK